jgi:transcriptional regulator with XRE-family HTH domain
MTDTSAVRQLWVVRRDAGLTLRELAERSDVALSTVWQIESGKQPRPQLATAMKVAGALGVDPHDIKEFQPVLATVESRLAQAIERVRAERTSEGHTERRAAGPDRSLPEELGGVVEQEIANVVGDEIFEVNVLLRPELVQKGAEQALDRLMGYLGRDTVDRIYERRFGTDSETRSDQEAQE